MISAPTRAPENLSLNRVKGIHVTNSPARADVGADIIRPRELQPNVKGYPKRKILFEQPFFQSYLLFSGEPPQLTGKAYLRDFFLLLRATTIAENDSTQRQ